VRSAIHLCVFGILIIILWGCAATPPVQMRSELNSKTSCCTRIQDAPVTTFLVPQGMATYSDPRSRAYEYYGRLDSSSLVFDFSQGRSYFSLLGLKGTGRLEISVGSARITTSGREYFAPLVTFYDSNRNQLTSDEPSFDVFRRTPDDSEVLRATIQVPKQASFVALHANPKRFGTVLPVMKNQPTGNLFYPSQRVEDFRIYFGPEGGFRLVLL
jgi:hypothetical protein